MTFTINRSLLAKELLLLQGVAERKTTIPALATVLTEFDGERLCFTVTDCSVTMQTEIEAEGEAWSGCIPLKQLAALSKLMEGDAVTIAARPNGRVEVKSGESKHVLPIFPVTDFPVIQKAETATEIAVNGDALREGLKRVLPCVTLEESRYTIQGVSFEAGKGTLQLVATDTHRLGVVSIPIDSKTEAKVLVPIAGLNALLKLDGDVTLKTGTTFARFDCGNRTISTQLLAGQFPNWTMIMPASQPYSLEFDSAQMQSALRRVAVTREESYKVGTGTILGGVRLDFHADRLRITTNINDKGESEEWVTARSNLNGEAIPMGINPDYLMDFLLQCDGQVKCEIKNSDVQALLTTGNFRYVIMPMRL